MKIINSKKVCEMSGLCFATINKKCKDLNTANPIPHYSVKGRRIFYRAKWIEIPEELCRSKRVFILEEIEVWLKKYLDS
jgi:hypothetical protein